MGSGHNLLYVQRYVGYTHFSLLGMTVPPLPLQSFFFSCIWIVFHVMRPAFAAHWMVFGFVHVRYLSPIVCAANTRQDFFHKYVGHWLSHAYIYFPAISLLGVRKYSFLGNIFPQPGYVPPQIPVTRATPGFLPPYVSPRGAGDRSWIPRRGDQTVSSVDPAVR